MFDQVTSVLSRIDARHFFPEIIGESIAMRGLLSLIMKVAPTDSTVLILGESGTGKELVATSIYQHSPRKDGPFIKLNCAAIPEELLESELFGHEKGAFTGATTFKPGKFDMADGGTIFLDEIGDMPLNLQAKILRVLQEKEFYRVGGSRTIKVDVRFIASTNKNLERMVQEGTFREDLFYRLNVFTLHLPPLRERKEDIPLLVDHFLKSTPKQVEISSVALQLLMGYAWPGNVRELKNVIESAAVIAVTNGYIEPAQLPTKITGASTYQNSRRLRHTIALQLVIGRAPEGNRKRNDHRGAAQNRRRPDQGNRTARDQSTQFVAPHQEIRYRCQADKKPRFMKYAPDLTTNYVDF